MAGEPLVRVPNATVYKVQRTTNTVNAIANGDFVIVCAATDGDGLTAQVGTVSWQLGRWAASLRFDDHTYAFQLPHAPYDTADVHYYCVTLRPDTPLELVDLLQAILASGSAYYDQERIVVQPQSAAAAGVALPPGMGAAPAAAPGPAVVPAAGPGGAPAAVRGPGDPQAPGSSQADRLASGLQRGGQLAAAGLMAAAAWTGVAIQRGAEAAVARMQPADRQRAPLSPEAQARVERAKTVAAKAAEVSGRVVVSAFSATAHIAGALAQRVSASELGRQMSNGRGAQDLRKVGLAGVEAVETVYDSLADAARVVLAHTHAATTRVVGHKYGPGAAQITDASMHMTQSAVSTGINVARLRPTALVKAAAKGAAKQVVLGSAGSNSSGASGSGRSQPSLPPAAAAGASTSGGVGPSGSSSSAAAAGSLLAALTRPPGAAPYQPYQVPYGPTNGGSGSCGAPSGASFVDGVVVSGPVPAHPVTPVYYNPAAAAVGPAAAPVQMVPLGPPASTPPAPPLVPAPMPMQGPPPSAPPSIISPTGSGGYSGYGAMPASQFPPPPGAAYPPGAVYPPPAAAANEVAGSGAGAAVLPYPAVSEAQYTSRFYPAVPRA